MNSATVYKLDNPVWYSLSESHENFSIDFDDLKFYHPDYCPFGGTKMSSFNLEDIAEYAKIVDKFFIVGNQPKLPLSLRIDNELVCLQMIITQPIVMRLTENIVALGESHRQSLFYLVNLVQPGYFKRKTASLGNYFGIYKDDMLIAVAGERMKMNDYVEVSAVVTHPDFRGKGYARQLIAHIVSSIIEQQKTPYLHVAEYNRNAIDLYNALGFVRRRKISFWKILHAGSRHGLDDTGL